METKHRLYTADARALRELDAASVHLVVTSPPYPMIAMWDEVFSEMNPGVRPALEAGDGLGAFELMHLELDRVWEECARVLRPGGFACINIGDATRTVGGDFRLYHNRARIVTRMVAAGFHVLPDIIWRKPTNAPNKFMGSGMLPAGAYVTYEHEYILIFRKGGRRVFRTAAQREARRRSAFFWEERNAWFSDVWMDLRGTRQRLSRPGGRERSAAFPVELPYRLISMYSVRGDTVLDPFVGTGTTMAAAVAAGRSSIGVEVSAALAGPVERAIREGAAGSAETARGRLEAHRRFVEGRLAAGKAPKYTNGPHGFPVMTRQERDMELLLTAGLERVGPGCFAATHRRLGEAPAPAEGADS